jgi:hypothetical protein
MHPLVYRRSGDLQTKKALTRYDKVIEKEATYSLGSLLLFYFLQRHPITNVIL